MGKPMNLRAAAGLAILLLAGCVTSGGPVRDANAQTTPLHEAALSGDAAGIRALLAGGADVDARDEAGATALHLAALSGDAAGIRALLAGGADVDARDDDGATALHAATAMKTFHAALEADAKSGHDEVSRVFFRAAGLDTMGPMTRNAFLTILKVKADHTGAIQALLAGGASVNARTKDEFTPLHFAAMLWGDVTAIRALLAGGAFVNARAKDGITPLHLAGDVTAIRALLAGGAFVNARDTKWEATPLHGTVLLSGDAAGIRALLVGGADVNARAKDGVTPLHAAAMTKMFLAALEADAKGGHDELLKAFFEAFPVMTEDLDMLDEAGGELFAAILKSFAGDRADTIRALLAGGADVNARAKGATPLHFAALSGDAAVVEALLDAGGGPNAVAFGCSPMDIARRRMENTEKSIAPFRDSIEALRAAGAQPREGCKF